MGYGDRDEDMPFGYGDRPDQGDLDAPFQAAQPARSWGDWLNVPYNLINMVYQAGKGEREALPGNDQSVENAARSVWQGPGEATGDPFMAPVDMSTESRAAREHGLQAAQNWTMAPYALAKGIGHALQRGGEQSKDAFEGKMPVGPEAKTRQATEMFDLSGVANYDIPTNIKSADPIADVALTKGGVNNEARYVLKPEHGPFMHSHQFRTREEAARAMEQINASLEEAKQSLAPPAGKTSIWQELQKESQEPFRGIRMTPEMRESIGKRGFPLFAKGDPFVAMAIAAAMEDDRPFVSSDAHPD